MSWSRVGNHADGLEVPESAASSEGSALDHFAFDVTNYDEALRRVRATGLKFFETTVPGSSVRQIFVRDLNGVSIELNWKGPSPQGR